MWSTYRVSLPRPYRRGMKKLHSAVGLMRTTTERQPTTNPSTEAEKMLSSDEGLSTQPSDTSVPTLASETPADTTHQMDEQQVKKEANAAESTVGRVWSKHPQSAS